MSVRTWQTRNRNCQGGLGHGPCGLRPDRAATLLRASPRTRPLPSARVASRHRSGQQRGSREVIRGTLRPYRRSRRSLHQRGQTRSVVRVVGARPQSACNDTHCLDDWRGLIFGAFIRKSAIARCGGLLRKVLQPGSSLCSLCTGS